MISPSTSRAKASAPRNLSGFFSRSERAEPKADEIEGLESFDELWDRRDHRFPQKCCATTQQLRRPRSLTLRIAQNSILKARSAEPNVTGPVLHA